MSGPPLVRSAAETDRARLTEILNATWCSTWRPQLPSAVDASWRQKDVARVFIDQVWAFCIVAEADGMVAGFAHMAADEVTSLHVDPHCKRRGLGAALMAAAENQARALGFRRLRVETEHFNTSAQAFYRALGYSETRRFTGDVIGHPLPCVEFSKPLS